MRFTFGLPLLVAALAALTATTLALWALERTHDWANNWLPNFIAEWTGILVAVAIVDRLRERDRREQLRPLCEHCYGELLHYLDNIAVNATSYLELFVTTQPGLEHTEAPVVAVHRMDTAFERGAVPDPNSRRCWRDMLRDRAATMDRICERHEQFIPNAVVVPVLELVNEMSTCAQGFGEDGSIHPARYAPIGDKFAVAYAAVAAAAGARS